MRVGFGYDVHRLVVGRKLVLGGIEVPFDKGLEGWSDADVLTHAIMDAILGAAALGDIGNHFPPDDPQYKGISSQLLLVGVKGKMAEKGWQVSNVDATIVAERPKLSDYIDRMRWEVGNSLGVEISRIGIKATTSEGLGFVGREEGIAAYAVVLIEPMPG